MPFPDVSAGPAAVMLAIMQRELDRESRRTGNAYATPRDRLGFGAVAPGIVHVRDGNLIGREHAFLPTMRAIADVADHAGPAALHKAIRKAAENKGMIPYPQNDPAWVQVGDTVGKARIETLTVGRSYDGAKTGDDRPCLPRAAFTGASAETIGVGFTDGKQAWWRRGTMVALSPAAPAGREGLRHLRRMHDDLHRSEDREMQAILEGKGVPERFVALVGIRSSLQRMLETVSSPAPATPDRAARTFLRQHMAELDRAENRLAARSHASFGKVLDTTLGLLRAERSECRAIHDRVCRKLKGERLVARGERMVAGAMTP